MAIFILILVCLSIGGFTGFKIGTHFIRQENITVLKQNALLQQFSNEWANAARNSTELTSNIAERQTSNLATTMQSVIQLLHAYQLQQTGNSNTTQNEKVSELIAKAKSIGKLHD